jgi:uncharacterized protein (TIGR02466 family)
MNTINYAVFPSIITEVFCDSYYTIRNSLIDWIYQYQKTTNTVIFSNRGGWQSPSHFHEQESFLEFKDFILNNTYIALQYYNCDFKLSNMWININKSGNYNTQHCHPKSILSGVFWVKTSDNCGKLSFQSPNSFVEAPLLDSMDENIKKDQNYYHTFDFCPQEGRIILFPSHLYHLVEPNESEEDRISIAFNLNT